MLQTSVHTGTITSIMELPKAYAIEYDTDEGGFHRGLCIPKASVLGGPFPSFPIGKKVTVETRTGCHVTRVAINERLVLRVH